MDEPLASIPFFFAFASGLCAFFVLLLLSTPFIIAVFTSAALRMVLLTLFRVLFLLTFMFWQTSCAFTAELFVAKPASCEMSVFEFIVVSWLGRVVAYFILVRIGRAASYASIADAYSL